MKKSAQRVILLLVVYILFPTSFSIAQKTESKGSDEVVFQNDAFQNEKPTYALVIGISDYKNIKSLSYADVDAAYFADFLLNNSNLGLKPENLLLLTNENAKQGDILSGFQWAEDNIGEGTNFVFYFSGHGDVEAIDEENPQGYLLAHDSPLNNYPIGGTIGVSWLDSMFNSLINRNCRLTIIIDACKSGQLAGGLTGKSYTAKNLNDRWKKVVSVLSAQPDQLSYESERWGGGRGVFSYYLIKGLSGYADMNSDFIIYLNELEQYIGMNVSRETDSNQQPFVEGPNKFSNIMSYGDSVLMNKYSVAEIPNKNELVLARSKSNELFGDNDCQQLQIDLSKAILNHVDFKEFAEIKKLWMSIQACAGPDVDSNYEYMRFLINKINEMVLISISGEKLLKEDEYRYGLQLISDLLQFVKNKHFYGYSHFENLKVYLQTLAFLYVSSDQIFENVLTFEYRSKKRIDKSKIESIIQSIDWDYYKPKGMLMNEYSFTWNNYYHFNNKFLNLLKELEEDFIVSVYFNQDTLIISSTLDSKRVDPPKNGVKFFEFYCNHLIKRINECLLTETNSAYLKYAKANLIYQNNKKEAIPLVLSSIEDSPTWLLPKYFLANIYAESGKFSESISIYESILSLDSIYRNFECIDCFYMSLIETYLSSNRNQDATELLNQWKKRLSKDDYWYWLNGAYINSMLENKKRNLIFWESNLWKETDYSLARQFDLMTTEFTIRNNRAKRKVMRKTVSQILAMLSDASFLAYIDQKNNRNKNYIEDKRVRVLMNTYFDDNKEIVLSDSIRSNIVFEVITQLEHLLLASESLLKTNDLDRLLLKSTLVDFTPDAYIEFLELFLQVLRAYDIVGAYDMNIGDFDHPEDLMYEMFGSEILDDIQFIYKPREIIRFLSDEPLDTTFFVNRSQSYSEYYQRKEQDIVLAIKKEIAEQRKLNENKINSKN